MANCAKNYYSTSTQRANRVGIVSDCFVAQLITPLVKIVSSSSWKWLVHNQCSTDLRPTAESPVGQCNVPNSLTALQGALMERVSGVQATLLLHESTYLTELVRPIQGLRDGLVASEPSMIPVAFRLVTKHVVVQLVTPII